MTAYKTPGVYIKEIPTLPASVAPVATAIPAFIGYTEKAEKNGVSLKNDPTRITSLMEYEKRFGGPHPQPGIEIDITAPGAVKIEFPSEDERSPYIMYYQMQMYFTNGGGPCYIVSVGNYEDLISEVDLQKGLDKVAMEDEPTLILFPDAKALSVDNFYGLYVAALAQCKKLQDRFTIINLHSDTADDALGDADEMRSTLASDYLNYGAAYYPRLKTSIPYYYRADEVSIKEPLKQPLKVTQLSYSMKPSSATGGIEFIYRYQDPGDTGTDHATIKIDTEQNAAGKDYIDFKFESAATTGTPPDTLTITLPDGDGAPATGTATVTQIVNAWDTWKRAYELENPDEKINFEINRLGSYQDYRGLHIDPAGFLPSPINLSEEDPADIDKKFTLEDLAGVENASYNAARAELAKFTVTLPPGPAIAGIYARTDNDRGVWIAPANTTMALVIEPTVRVTDEIQENLNVDPTSGKSVNAIRTFAGKGTLVWGARTLAGNDNEWRYVPTRRLFIMVEESVKKATYWAVFEPNDANTWMKVKTQIENFLNGLWKAGALAGASPADAYFVNIGLGVTMDSLDILEGRMNVEIGMAAVRPAEFIILKFSHKLQES